MSHELRKHMAKVVDGERPLGGIVEADEKRGRGAPDKTGVRDA